MSVNDFSPGNLIAVTARSIFSQYFAWAFGYCHLVYVYVVALILALAVWLPS